MNWSKGDVGVFNAELTMNDLTGSFDLCLLFLKFPMGSDYSIWHVVLR